MTPRIGATMIDRDGDVYEIQGPHLARMVNFLHVRCMVGTEGEASDVEWRSLARRYGIRYMTPREVLRWKAVREESKEILKGVESV